MTKQEMMQKVHAALSAVNPQYMGRQNSVGGVGVRVEEFGDKFDVMLTGTDIHTSEYSAAVRAIGPDGAKVVIL